MRSTPHLVAAFLVTLAASQSTPSQTLRLPPRSTAAPTGSEILQRIGKLSVKEREAVLWDEFTTGNIPAFLRHLIPIAIVRSIGGKLHRATVHVTPDYLAVGSDTDFFRVPLTPILAQHLADRTDCVLPTRKIVDETWSQATVKLAPFPFNPATNNILSPTLFYRHHLEIEKQRRGNRLGELVAGIKKDVVSSALIASNPNRVVIYGWHRLNGTAIQPLSKIHVNFYADYSHGTRLVQDSISLDGSSTTIQAVLADPKLHPILSDEGQIISPGYIVPTPPETMPYLDRFPSNGPQLKSWRAKFTAAIPRAFQPRPPGGDGFVLEVRDPAGGTDSIRLGHTTTTDCVIQADVYCNYRPKLHANGFERVGVFARDNAAGAFDGTRTQHGACYALAWDSSDGRLWCMRAKDGVLVDLLAQPLYLPSTAWRRLRIEARGPGLSFLVDGSLVLAVTDHTYPSGEFGIGHHEYFASNANMQGAVVDNWVADVPDALALSLHTGPANELVVDSRGGVPGDLYFTPITLTAGAFPKGWFYGIDAPVKYLGALLGSGHPAFVGIFDERGRARQSVVGIPSGLMLYGVTIDVFRKLPPVGASKPISFRVH